LAIVATRNAGADLGHLVQTVPKTRRIDAQVFTGCGHGSLPYVAEVLMPLATNLFLTVWSEQSAPQPDQPVKKILNINP
jgi:hypothetical protein